MLDEQQVRDVVARMWVLQTQDRLALDRIHAAVLGRSGRPEVPEGSSSEVKNLAAMSVLNVLGMVRNSFTDNLSVVGYRSADSQENDPAWALWKRNRMDARQAEPHRAAVTYGSGFALVKPGDRGPVIHTRSPRQILAVYDDPTLDEWPVFAMQTWVSEQNARKHWRATLFDDRFTYELDLGELPVGEVASETVSKPPAVRSIDEVTEHGAVMDGRPVCPVVRFVNDRDADDPLVGEIAPLLNDQWTINEVNFDRLIVARFAASPQKVITGWQGSREETLRASASRVWTFEDAEVRATALPAASMKQYDETLSALFEHVAMVAGLSPAQMTGRLVNVSAEALAAAEATLQRKLAAKRESFGESWKQVMRLCAAMDGDSATAADSEAEIVWRDTEARTFAGIVDGIVKLGQAGVPLEPMIPMIPGLTQPQVKAMKDGLRAARVSDLVGLLGAPEQQQATPPPG